MKEGARRSMALALLDDGIMQPCLLTIAICRRDRKTGTHGEYERDSATEQRSER
jgi:hypothetical protein